MNCYISRNYKGTTSAGNKAKTDIETIMTGMGYKNVGLRQTTYSNSILHFLMTLFGVLKTPFCLHKGDMLVVQYPLKKYFAFVCNMAHLRGAKVTALIHDLGSFRRKALTIEQEIARLNHADCVIAHNKSMKKWLEDNGCKAKLVTLDIFDYLSATSAQAENALSSTPTVVYVGALSIRKNKFLYDFGDSISNYRVNVYGNGFDADKASNPEAFTTMGFIQSDRLIETAQGHFGLVWDGNSLDACSGDFGEYMKFNNPHKTSLYLRCLMPIIIWNEAALAPFVRENGIGITINSLRELDEILAKITPEEYQQMRNNVKTICDRLSSGYYAKNALTEAAGLLGNN